MAECQKILPSPPSTASLLLTRVLNDSQGQVSAAVYDTARLVALTPWLPGHVARLDYLISRQAADGTWGGPDSYTIVPTLSATEALLAELNRANSSRRPDVIHAVGRSLAVLQRQLEHPTAPTPDTIAVEFVVPALVKAINTMLESPTPTLAAALPTEWLNTRVNVPASLDPRLPTAFADRINRGIPLPDKMWVALEAFGTSAISAQFIRPAGGAVAGSPSATAGWLGPSASFSSPAAAESARYLGDLQSKGAGAVPAVSPITYFELAWVLNSLAAGHLRYDVPPGVLDRLESALGDNGAPAGPGIPADSDDTAAVLSALARHGRIHSPDVLMQYQTDAHFMCFPGERTPSISTNAHVLEALLLTSKAQPRAETRFRSAVSVATDWLLLMQRADGSWIDKWHASPYYATACCVTSLAMLENGRTCHALESATRWVLDTQRTDGSWGCWTGTIEETSYAVQILLMVSDIVDFEPTLVRAIAHSTAAGAELLRTHDDPETYAPLWHAKDLYAPFTVISAARLAALGLYNRLSMRRTG